MIRIPVHRLPCLAILAASLALAAGCRTAPEEAPPAQGIHFAGGRERPAEFVAGRVTQVNGRFGYVILECGNLLSDGEEARVYRDDRVVASLRVTGPGRAPFTVADIVEGAPRAGDIVKVVGRPDASAPETAGKE